MAANKSVFGNKNFAGWNLETVEQVTFAPTRTIAPSGTGSGLGEGALCSGLITYQGRINFN